MPRPPATGCGATTSLVHRALRAWLDAHAAWPLEWQDVAGASDFVMRLSPAGWPPSRPRSRRCSSASARSSPRPTMPADRSSRSTCTPSRSAGADHDRPRRPLGADPLPHPGRPPLAADRAAHPGHRAARPVARPVADRDRPRLQPPGARRPLPRAADRRPVRCARPPARPDPRRAWSASSRSASSTSPTRWRCSPPRRSSRASSARSTAGRSKRGTWTRRWRPTRTRRSSTASAPAPPC